MAAVATHDTTSANGRSVSRVPRALSRPIYLVTQAFARKTHVSASHLCDEAGGVNI